MRHAEGSSHRFSVSVAVLVRMDHAVGVQRAQGHVSGSVEHAVREHRERDRPDDDGEERGAGERRGGVHAVRGAAGNLHRADRVPADPRDRPDGERRARAHHTAAQ